MLLDILPLALVLFVLFIYLAVRWRYRYTCPECGRWSRERIDISFTYQASEREEPGKVKIPAGGCSCCSYFWTLKDTHVKDTGLIIPKGTRMGRPD